MNLKNILNDMKSVAVAFSGGVDSSFLLKVAYDCLGDKCLAVTAISPVMLQNDREAIDKVIGEIGAKNVFIESHEMDDKNFVANPTDRCYYCKTNTFGEIIDYAKGKSSLRFQFHPNVSDKICQNAPKPSVVIASIIHLINKMGRFIVT